MVQKSQKIVFITLSNDCDLYFNILRRSNARHKIKLRKINENLCIVDFRINETLQTGAVFNRPYRVGLSAV